jgi:KDO2-lipid IV(A) lauroyltransferase
MSARHRLEYAGYRVLAALARTLPLTASQRLAELAARATYRLGARHVAEALENLRLAFPELGEPARLRILRESQIHLFWNAIDLVRAQSWSAEETERHVELRGLKHIEDSRKAGRGVIILTLHMGNFELGVRRFAILGEGVLVLNRPLPNPLLNDAIAASRGGAGVKLIDRDAAAVPMLRQLRRGGLVALLNDRYARRGAVWAPFFGVRAATAAGVAALALRTGAPVHPAYIVRDQPDHHRLELLPEIAVPTTGDREKDVEAVTAAHNRALEDIIRRHPEQWMWRHRRFRNSPDLPGGAAA